jgi:hypothetical protein
MFLTAVHRTVVSGAPSPERYTFMKEESHVSTNAQPTFVGA